MTRSICAALVGVFFFALPASCQLWEYNPAEGILQPGDRLSITVWRMPEMSGEFEIAPDSTLVHPLYRQVKVAGAPLYVAEQRLREYLVTLDSDPQFVVQPLIRITLGGEVISPDLYHHPKNVTISQAITLAGGVNSEGDLGRVRLIRSGTMYALNLSNPMAAEAQIPLSSGDQILVGRRRSIFRDYISPLSSVVGAASGVVLLLLRTGAI
jgi:protein involved in polysaccharide export with SLBB domain